MAALVSSTPSTPFPSSISACPLPKLSKPAPHAAARARCSLRSSPLRSEPRAPANATERTAAFGQGAPHAEGTHMCWLRILQAPDAADTLLASAPQQADMGGNSTNSHILDVGSPGTSPARHWQSSGQSDAHQGAVGVRTTAIC